jgi:bifunctional ADP-heptose synthase (sugar kinase/adenylyltransferase)
MTAGLLSTERIEQILERAPRLTIGVLGDLFLDRYLILDDQLTEVSLETGLDAYQVVDVRPSPGAAGTIINNLAALGVGCICPLAVVGDDGEGYELGRCLAGLGVVDLSEVFPFPGRRTPTYTKPMLQKPGEPARELNRLDIHNRSPLPAEAEERVLAGLERVWKRVDALIVLDQVSLPDCGVVTSRVRQRLRELGESDPERFVLADSREQIGAFLGVCVKPNLRECLRALGLPATSSEKPETVVLELARRSGRPVFCTLGERGQLLVVPGGPGTQEASIQPIPAYPVTGPIDPVGAGDSTSAGISTAVAGGASLPEAAAFGNLVASITVTQLGTTGTASPAQVRQRWREV